MSRLPRTLASALALLPAPLALAGTGRDELSVKRQAVFEFAERPRIARAGDGYRIAFATKGLCDVTVAVENAKGRIVRHLACGVLGDGAPPPLRRGSKRQVLVWDGKDDAGRYVADPAGHTVRVSLGLRPRFERTLFWSPHKRIGADSPVFAPAPEGVYVLENYVLDHNGFGGVQLRLFDHEGQYVRTVYPFPAGKVEAVPGVRRHEFAHLGKTLPLKGGYYQADLLETGLGLKGNGLAPHGLAVHGRKLALAYVKLNRLTTDGSAPAAGLGGATIGFSIMTPASKPRSQQVGPRSAAFSPDGKWVYLTGYVWRWRGWYCDWRHAVLRVPFDGGQPEVFVGSLKENDWGTDNTRLKVPTSVACDAKGRVYVSDYLNDRIQVFTPDGRHFKTIGVPRPAHVEVHRKTGEIYVFSWFLVTRLTKRPGTKPTFTRLGPVENPRRIATCPLPLVGHSDQISWNNTGGLPFRVALDSWAPQPTIWLTPGRAIWRSSGNSAIVEENWRNGVRLLVEKNGRLVERRDFTKDAARDVVRVKPPILWRQRLYVNPASGRLYVAEGDSGVMKSFNQLVEIDPRSGRTRLVDLPLGSEDMCFGPDGVAYLRTDKIVARYDSRSWREIPWDYGEERQKHSWGMGARSATLTAGLVTPGHRSNPFWHMGGIDVSLKGHLAVTTCNLTEMDSRLTLPEKARFRYTPRPYTPRLYAGRMRWGEIHVYDRHGKLIHEDAVAGMGHLNGIGIDRDDNLYMLAAVKRLIGGKPLHPKLSRDVSGTLIKVKAGRAKVLSASDRRTPIPLPAGARPDRPMEIKGWPTGWVDGAEWFYGGVGFCTPGGCICCNCRFDLDYFNRSFAPEPLTYTVAVLDAAGNLILRVGRYGNADDGMPLEKRGGPARPRAIGGDEVALFGACYVAADTDRRLFIADAGNARILSVRLGYHTDARLSLSDLPAMQR